MKTGCRPSQTGFTLMESVVALLLLGIVSAALIQLNGNLFWQSSSLRSWQQGAPMLQSCMAKLLATPKATIFAAPAGASSQDCSSLNVSPLSLTVTYGAVIPNCSSGMDCRLVQIAVSGIGSTVNLKFVNY